MLTGGMEEEGRAVGIGYFIIELTPTGGGSQMDAHAEGCRVAVLDILPLNNKGS